MTHNNPEAAPVFPVLARSRNLVTLWMLRMLVHLDAADRINERVSNRMRQRIAGRLGTPEFAHKLDDGEASDYAKRLAATLRHLESSNRHFDFPARLASNLELLGKRFSLTGTERKILALAVLFRSDEVFFTIGELCIGMVNATEQIHTIIRSPASEISRATSPRGMLRRAGLVDFSSGCPPVRNVQIRRGGLRAIATEKISEMDGLFNEFIRLAPPPVLTAAQFGHVVPDIHFLQKLLSEAIRSGRVGCNVLIYGPPGTGKTEITRVLAKEAGVVLYEMANHDSDGKPSIARDRLGDAGTAQALLAKRPAMLVFDEVDDIFNDGSSFFGKPSTAESAKAWVNQLLEENPVPTIWIANRVNRMDNAFIRRFDAVVNLKSPPLTQRLNQLRLSTQPDLDEQAIKRFAASDRLTPGVIARACNVASRVGAQGQSKERLVESLLDSTLRAQGHPTIKEANRNLVGWSFDPSWCNTGVDLVDLAHGLRKFNSGRVCLYGPPGTGKTAFGRWLAESLDKPLLLKRMSDLQSPYLGVMERNLADAFEEAIRNDAILQIDEVDSFLRNRELARQAWEVSQVNEFLTQMEAFEGIFIATTNLVEGIDTAALRRFDYKIHVDYLRSGQLQRVVSEKLVDWGLCQTLEADLARKLSSLSRVSMGDIAALSRRHKISAFGSPDEFIDALAEEVRLKGGVTNRMGFL